MTERLKPLGEMFGLPQDFNEDTKDKVTELKISQVSYSCQNNYFYGNIEHMIYYIDIAIKNI